VDSLTPKTVDALRAMVPHTVCVVDASGGIRSANPGWIARFGEIGEPGSTDFIDVLCPTCAPVVTQALERARAGEIVEPFTLRCMRDGEHASWFEWHLGTDGHGGVVVIGRDITEARRRSDATDELRMLEDEAERIAGLGSWRLDLATNELTWSPEMYRLLEVDPESGVDLVEASRTALGLDPTAAQETIGRTVADPDGVRFARFKIDLPSGGVRWLHVQGHVAFDEGGRPKAIVGFAQDVTVPVLAEAALNAGEERYRSIIDGMQDGYLRADTTGRIVLANAATARMYGYDGVDDMLGVDVIALYADVGDRESVLAELREKGHVVDRVGRGRRKDGSTFWVSLNMQPVLDAAGAVVGTEGFNRDITDRISAEEALRDSETKFRTIADFTYDWEMWTAPDGAVIYISPSCERVTGYTAAEFLSDPALLDRIVHPEDSALVSGHLGQHGDRGPCPVNFRIVRKDGEVRWLEHVCEPVTDAEGNDLGRRSGNRDITERVLAEEARGTMVSLLQATLESTADGLLVVDRDNRIASYNTRFVEMMGAPKSMMVAGDDEALLDFVAQLQVDPDSFRAHVAHLYSMQDAESFDTLEFKDGRVFERYSRPQMLKGRVVGRVWSFRDVSMSARAERALHASEETLRDAQAIARIGSYEQDIIGDKWTSSEALDDIFGIDWAYRRDLGGFLALVHADDREMMARYFTEEVVGKRQPFDKEYRVVRHTDGATVWVHGRGRLELDAAGVPVKMVGTIQDVTLRHRDEEELRRTNASLERMVYEVAEAMGRVIEIRDQYTQGHQERVARLCRAIAMEMELPAHDVMAVEMAGVIHDIGKLSVPAEILTRPAALTKLEFAFIREHPQNGYDILKDIPFPWPVAQIVLEHHERMDGSGYPAGLTGENILPLARLLAVADVVEAMSTHRPYRAALGVDAAIAELRGGSDKYDPDVVAACVRLYERGEIEL